MRMMFNKKQKIASSQSGVSLPRARVTPSGSSGGMKLKVQEEKKSASHYECLTFGGLGIFITARGGV
jgi:hypothetical protein